MTLTQKIIQNLSRNKNVQSFLADFDKVSSELKGKSKQLNQLWTSEKHKTVKQAYAQYQKMVRSISKAQMELDREVSKAISLIVKSADDVEKNLSAYKKKAVAQKAKIEKALLKKASPRKTTRAPRRGVAAAAQKGAAKRAPKKAIGRASARRA
ncbi:MAG: actin-binding protein [Bdellovibrionales bacterium]|jgi:hypothetical protein|nr:actin-binding protein [Bdellovibrionales bacterium]